MIGMSLMAEILAEDYPPEQVGTILFDLAVQDGHRLSDIRQLATSEDLPRSVREQLWTCCRSSEQSRRVAQG
jgi:hypothetical protein